MTLGIISEPKLELEATNGSINRSKDSQPYTPTVEVILTPKGLSSFTDANTCSIGVSADTTI
jgi:hypothetical protein